MANFGPPQDLELAHEIGSIELGSIELVQLELFQLKLVQFETGLGAFGSWSKLVILTIPRQFWSFPKTQFLIILIKICNQKPVAKKKNRFFNHFLINRSKMTEDNKNFNHFWSKLNFVPNFAPKWPPNPQTPPSPSFFLLCSCLLLLCHYVTFCYNNVNRNQESPLERQARSSPNTWPHLRPLFAPFWGFWGTGFWGAFGAWCHFLGLWRLAKSRALLSAKSTHISHLRFTQFPIIKMSDFVTLR